MAEGSKIQYVNNSLGSRQETPMPRGGMKNAPKGVKVLRTGVDGHGAGAGVGLAAANIHDTEASYEEMGPTYDYGYYGEQGLAEGGGEA